MLILDLLAIDVVQPTTQVFIQQKTALLNCNENSETLVKYRIAVRRFY